MLSTDFDHDRLGARLRQYFLDELSREEGEDLRAHIRTCARCRAEYERWASAERGLFSKVGPISPLAIDRVARGVLPRDPKAEPKPLAGRALVYAFASAAALVLAGRFFLGEGFQPEVFSSRGAAVVTTEELSVRIVVARFESAGAPRVFDLGSAGEVLRPGDKLQVRITRARPGQARVFFEQGGVAKAVSAIESIAPGEDVALSALITVGDEHQVGALSLVIVVADEASMLQEAPRPVSVDEPGRSVRVVGTEVVR